MHLRTVRTVRSVRSVRSARRCDERGITTAEYAVGTAAGAGLAGLLYKMLTGGFGDQLLTTLFDHVLGLLGVS
jgi:outer membrane lipoprotein SlyB